MLAFSLFVLYSNDYTFSLDMKLQLPFSLCSLLILSTSISLADSQLATNNYTSHAINASQVLINDYYIPSTGLFSNLWWNTAVTLTTLTSLQTISPNATSPPLSALLSTVFTKPRFPGFINGFYDDEGWWALLWLSAYDLTSDPKYLTAASSIWTNMRSGWRTQQCGGVWWDKAHTQENAIANVLFLSVSANVAARVPDTNANRTTYIDWAQKEWDWFAHSGMLKTSPQGGVAKDSYNHSTCRVKLDLHYTYTQGVLIGALLALNKVSPSPDLLTNATAIADASIVFARFNDANGIFTEPVGLFDDDTAQWKGIFMSNLVLLQREKPKEAYLQFLRKNADSVWNAARFANGTLSPRWDSRDPKWKVSAASQSSGLAALVAAASVTDGGNGS